MSPEYHEVSPYYAQMSAIIEAWRSNGVGAFTPHDLAAAMGRKVTASQRAALNRACKLGVLRKFHYINENTGGRCVCYEIIQSGQMKLEFNEVPF